MWCMCHKIPATWIIGNRFPAVCVARTAYELGLNGMHFGNKNAPALLPGHFYQILMAC
jgi:hypothetical protein